ncbi:MAG: DUF1080 domain-containing protein [Planctomycetaceae bacterium]|jgi:histidinol phosphatase-like PHP family hydrolase|nr:DUF1080 domain-containing protein [Planctomycetaceae bacterium]
MKTNKKLLIGIFCCLTSAASVWAEENWTPLFDGKSLDGWKASESQTTWSAIDGALVSNGARSHLFYDGKIADHRFKNFELRLQFKLEGKSNSGLFFHTEFSDAGSPPKGYEVQINSSDKETRKTGSLFAVRGIYADFVKNGTWTDLWLKVSERRIQVKVNGMLLADYVEPKNAPRTRKGRVLSSGTFALQAHDPETRAAYRNIAVKILPDSITDDGGDTSYLFDPPADLARQIDEFGSRNVPLIDYHIHLRGGMTAEKALILQAKTGVQSGVLENAGADWPLSDNEKIRAFIEAAEQYPVYIGLQVNDRDWFKAISSDLLKRLDYILADTMIMNDENGKPQKLWLEEQYKIDDAKQWFERYFAHCMTVVKEPITIMANPTYLPLRIADKYDELWTKERMTQLIDAAVKNNVAFEIQAGSAFPGDQFIELAKAKDAKFTIGRNNHFDKMIDMTSCFEKLRKHKLAEKNMLLLAPKTR